ncbi:MAG: precorrin-3B synthase [Methylobacterium sp.]
MSRALPDSARRGWCPGLSRPMPTGDGLLARIHPPLGVLSLAQSRAVAEGARRYGNGHLDLTARANLQIRGVTEATTAPLATLLDQVGLGDTRRDGGPQRLTLTSPLAEAGLSALAKAIEDIGRGVPGLPPKTLVAVGMAMDEADLSVLPLAADRVAIVAGTSAWECGSDDTPSAIGALLAAFVATGQRRMRDVNPDALRHCEPSEAIQGSATSQSLAGKLIPPLTPPHPEVPRSGVEGGLRTAPRSLEPSFEATAALRHLRMRSRVKEPPTSRSDTPNVAPLDRFAPLAMTVAVPAPGLSTHDGRPVLALDAPFGRCAVGAWERLIAVAEDIGAPEIRLSPSRGMVLLPSRPERIRLADLAADFIVAADDPRRAVAACTGAPACASGSTPTLLDAARLAETFRPLAARGLSAHVSGCAKGCAKPGPADLTLVGHEGAYAIIVGGAPGDSHQLEVPIEAALERLGRAATLGLAAAFASATNDGGRNRRPA